MSRTVALTGATGFIGSVLARRLHAENWTVRALVRTSAQAEKISNIPIKPIKGDLSDLNSLRCLVEGVDAVVHCAGLVRGNSLKDFQRVNVDGLENILTAASDLPKAPQFLLLSSLAARVPKISAYAESKFSGEQRVILNKKNIPWTILRPPAVYGPNEQDLKVIWDWMRRGIALKLGPANARFSLLYVDDLADAVIACLKTASKNSGVLELHDGYSGGYTWDNVIDVVGRLSQRHIQRIQLSKGMLSWIALCNVTISSLVGALPVLTTGKVRELWHDDWVCDNADISNLTGWYPKVVLDEGLRRTFKIESVT